MRRRRSREMRRGGRAMLWVRRGLAPRLGWLGQGRHPSPPKGSKTDQNEVQGVQHGLPSRARGRRGGGRQTAALNAAFFGVTSR